MNVIWIRTKSKSLIARTLRTPAFLSGGSVPGFAHMSLVLIMYSSSKLVLIGGFTPNHADDFRAGHRLAVPLPVSHWVRGR